MTSEAAVSSSPAISKSPAKVDYYWLRSFVAGGRTSPSSLSAHLSASDRSVKLVPDARGQFRALPQDCILAKSSSLQPASALICRNQPFWLCRTHIFYQCLLLWAAELYPLIGDILVLAEL